MGYIHGTIYNTRFAELGFTKIEPGCWSFVDVTEPDSPSKVGAHYPSREQLVASIERYAAEYGCEGADKTLRENHAQPQAATPDNIGKAVARCVFDRRGNHSEIHLSEPQLAGVITEAIKLYAQKAKGGN